MAKLKKCETSNNISASLENYLEAIAMLKKKKRYARIGDIAKTLNVKNSSANEAIKFLTEHNFVIHEKYGHVDLTPDGEMLALEVQKKHDILYDFLNKILFINDKVAIREACDIEHYIGLETMYKIEKLHLWIKKHFLKSGDDILTLKKYLEII
ncbi:MAG: metal-dependent transcriptional regulator [Endomicrobium sp.]|jgi:DtxR family Mn-dependent transcriptional regulator|nr:metal-dependent transcriptional regulator [Endomicrobium sp.]